MRPIPEVPAPGQESVWDYPRPPVVRPTDAHVQVWFAEHLVADTHRALRVLETSQAPAYYLPLDDVDAAALVPTDHLTWCEWKGTARHLDVVVGERRAARGAWTYPDPVPAFTAIAGHVAFYPQAMDRCLVDGEVVEANAGGFYGGWVTSQVVGPFKGAPGSMGW